MNVVRRTPGGAHPPPEGFQVSLVVPVRREVQRVGAVMTRIGRFLQSVPWRCEVVVLDDGSDDGTAEAAARWTQYIDTLVVARHGASRGRGAAARTGVLLARGSVVVLVDPRLEVPLQDTVVLVEHLQSGADVAVASRRLPGAEMGEQSSFLDRASQTTFTALSRLMVPLEVRDTACELIAFRRPAARRIAQRSTVQGDAFGFEWLVLSTRLGLQVIELPASWLDEPTGQRPRPNELTMLRDLWRIRRNLGDGGYEKPRAAQELLHQTRFVKAERKGLLAGRDKARR